MSFAEDQAHLTKLLQLRNAINEAVAEARSWAAADEEIVAEEPPPDGLEFQERPPAPEGVVGPLELEEEDWAGMPGPERELLESMLAGGVLSPVELLAHLELTRRLRAVNQIADLCGLPAVVAGLRYEPKMRLVLVHRKGARGAQLALEATDPPPSGAYTVDWPDSREWDPVVARRARGRRAEVREALVSVAMTARWVVDRLSSWTVPLGQVIGRLAADLGWSMAVPPGIAAWTGEADEAAGIGPASDPGEQAAKDATLYVSPPDAAQATVGGATRQGAERVPSERRTRSPDPVNLYLALMIDPEYRDLSDRKLCELAKLRRGRLYTDRRLIAARRARAGARSGTLPKGSKVGGQLEAEAEQ